MRRCQINKITPTFGTLVVFLLNLQPKTNSMIGRKQEIELLEQAYHSNRSEFIAIYGRRRVGKTFLVRQLFADKFAFTYSGMPNVSTKIQLHNFYRELLAQGC